MSRYGFWEGIILQASAGDPRHRQFLNEEFTRPQLAEFYISQYL